jgi:hypothetical protein
VDLPRKQAMIGICSYKTVPAEAFASLMRTAIESVGAGLVSAFQVQTNMYVVMARNGIVEAALAAWKEGLITHLWWLDDDMIVPQGTLERLMARDVPVVGAAYYTNDLKPVAYDINPFKFLDAIPDGGLHRVGGLGMGCTLVDCRILADMKRKYDDGVWFATSTHFEQGKTPLFYGEDVWFFQRIKEMEIPVYIDCDVVCGHVHHGVIDGAAAKLKARLQREQGLGPSDRPEVK